MKKIILSALFISFIFIGFFGFTQDLETSATQGPEAKQEYAGEFFGYPVPIGNYYFAKKAVLTFNAKWRAIPQTAQEVEDMVWQELLFSYEAFRRNIEATSDQIDEQVDKMLAADKAEFDWRQDNEAFSNWCKEKTGLTPEMYRNQLEHLLKLEALRQEIIDSFEPEVTPEEAHQKFLDEYNTLSVELLQFTDLKEAETFLDRQGKKEKAPY